MSWRLGELIFLGQSTLNFVLYMYASLRKEIMEMTRHAIRPTGLHGIYKTSEWVFAGEL